MSAIFSLFDRNRSPFYYFSIYSITLTHCFYLFILIGILHAYFIAINVLKKGTGKWKILFILRFLAKVRLNDK